MGGTEDAVRYPVSNQDLTQTTQAAHLENAQLYGGVGIIAYYLTRSTIVPILYGVRQFVTSLPITQYLTKENA